MQRFGPPLSTHSLDRLHFKFARFDLIDRKPQTWVGFALESVTSEKLLKVYLKFIKDYKFYSDHSH